MCCVLVVALAVIQTQVLLVVAAVAAVSQAKQFIWLLQLTLLLLVQVLHKLILLCLHRLGQLRLAQFQTRLLRLVQLQRQLAAHLLVKLLAVKGQLQAVQLTR
jgi:hypothetical protein